MQQGVPRNGRALPGMPLEMQDPDDDEPTRPQKGKFGAAPGHWWRPASTVGRVALALAALLVLTGVTAACLALRTHLERDARFRIDGASQIQAAGLTEVSRSQLLPIFGEDIGRNIFFVPIGERRKALEAIPWVQHATVMRLLPDQIRVTVVERKPVAFTRHGQQIGLVDANGVLLGMSPTTMAAHHYSFPVVTGINAGDKLESRKARMDVYARLMAELDANNQHYSEQISEIDLTDPEDARVLMPAQGTDILAHFGEDHFLERYQRYQAHIAEWRQQYPKLAAVDLRYDHQMVLEMVSGANTTQSAGLSNDAPKPDADGAPLLAQKAPEQVSSKPSAKTTSVAKSSSVKSSKAKPAARHATSPAKSKSAAAKSKTAHDRKRAHVSTVALKLKSRKPSPAARPSAAKGQ